jgi:hypothetical protein
MSRHSYGLIVSGTHSVILSEAKDLLAATPLHYRAASRMHSSLNQSVKSAHSKRGAV